MTNWLDEFVNNTDLTQNRPIREVVYESLKNVLISGTIPVGERIIEKEYASRLNISRTPVRDALKQLEAENLVEYIPRVGVVTKSITKDNVFEIYKIREALEILILETAITNITDEEIVLINKNILESQRMHEEDNVDEIVKLFEEFNWLIYKSSKMQILPSLIANLNSYLQRFRTISIQDKTRRIEAINEHALILECIVNKDRDLGIETIKKHLNVSINVVSKKI
ncbi:GntR family transcriptional regulator [Romboutsia sp. CE17]|uniref:GntR family transcriptional regulator n=1 Tax=Romboutsia sp. CE17 TaxID=2724150 RepID=UPI001442CF27|nr:GntR family transcriptional regulator [Romboutsia sp. CE17]QJA07497.1 GntR family transcriptional regulator [Romboutsia sp. CE17]